MKHFIFILIAAFAGINICSATLRLSLKPGGHYYADSVGLSGAMEAQFGLNYFDWNILTGLFAGVEISYNTTLLDTNITCWQTSAAIEAGMTIPVFAGYLSYTPMLKVGGSLLGFSKPATNLLTGGFFLAPALSIDWFFSPEFSIGLETEYRWIPNNFVSLTYINSTLAISYTFKTSRLDYTFPQPSRQEEPTNSLSVLSRDINNIIIDQKIQASVSKENDKEIKLSLSDLLFDKGSEKVSKSYIDAIKSIVRSARDYPQLIISIEGHTDDVGDEDYNAMLSARRAKNVAELFIANGMSSSQVSYKGWGKERPLLPNSSDDNRARNRRVEIRFIWK